MRRPFRRDLEAAAGALLRKRGRATDLQRMFETTRIPMVWLDSDGRYLDANAPSRLFLRRTGEELRTHSPRDFIPRARWSQWNTLWNVLLTNGSVAGSSTIRMPDGATVRIDYCGVANLLPGRHLVVWLPTDWHAVELGAIFEAAPRKSGRLSNREREVLSVLATGANLQEISEQLSLSPHTVKTHLRNALQRLGARHRAHAIALALRDGEI